MSHWRRWLGPAVVATLLTSTQGCGSVPHGVSGPGIGTLHVFGPQVTVNGVRRTRPLRIQNGDSIATGSGSRAELRFDSRGFVRLEENTDPEFFQDILEFGRCLIRFLVSQGSIAGQTGDCDTRISVPSGQEILPNSRYVLTVSGDTAVFTLLDFGSALVRGQREVPVPSGHQVVLSKDFISDPRPLTRAEYEQLLGWLVSFDRSPGRVLLVEVPRIRGLRLDSAERELAASRLALGAIEPRSAPQATPGTILDQRPAAGAMVPPGTAVYVDVAAGAAAAPKLVKTPFIVGMQIAEAEAELSVVGLRIGKTEEREIDTVPPGTVISQFPVGTETLPGTSVDVVVAIAPEPTPPEPPSRVRVPDLGARSQIEAEALIEKASLRLGQITEEPTHLAKSGTVLRQSPPASSRVAPGTPVDLVIATAVTREACPVTDRPQNGEIIFGKPEGLNSLIINNEENEDVFIKLRSRSGRDIVGFYVRARSRAGVETLPPGVYTVYHATGRDFSRACATYVLDFEAGRLTKPYEFGDDPMGLMLTRKAGAGNTGSEAVSPEEFRGGP